MTQLSPETWLVTGGRPEQDGSPLNVPLVPASNFLLGGERQYSREDSTPTWAALEELIGVLEGGESVAFSSGDKDDFLRLRFNCRPQSTLSNEKQK